MQQINRAFHANKKICSNLLYRDNNSFKGKLQSTVSARETKIRCIIERILDNIIVITRKKMRNECKLQNCGR